MWSIADRNPRVCSWGGMTAIRRQLYGSIIAKAFLRVAIGRGSQRCGSRQGFRFRSRPTRIKFYDEALGTVSREDASASRVSDCASGDFFPRTVCLGGQAGYSHRKRTCDQQRGSPRIPNNSSHVNLLLLGVLHVSRAAINSLLPGDVPVRAEADLFSFGCSPGTSAVVADPASSGRPC